MSRKLLHTPNAKKVLPVAASPAIAVILLFGNPPYILPDNKALKAYEPVSIKLLTSPPITPSDARLAYSLPVSFIISFKKSFILLPQLSSLYTT